MSDDRFHELTACNAAKQAVEDFDKRHAAKADALKRIATALERGGWGAIKFQEELPLNIRNDQHVIDNNRDIVSQKALDGDRIETVVHERRRLMQQWEAAYASVPEPIRNSAPNPHGSAARLRERHRGR